MGRFELSETDRKNYLDLLWRMAEIVDPLEIPEVVKKDPDDDMLFGAAIEGRADLIVTGDKNVLEVEEYIGVQVVRTSRALELLGN